MERPRQEEPFVIEQEPLQKCSDTTTCGFTKENDIIR